MPRLFVRIISLVFAAAIGVTGQPQPSAAQRTVVADYMEDRSAHVHACNCEWSAEGELAGTEAIVAWRFRSGEFQGTSLAGVKVAFAICGDRNLAVLAWDRKSQLLVDRSATPRQQEAAESFLREHYGTLFGRVVSRQPADVDFVIDPDHASLAIKDVLRLEMREARIATDTLVTSQLMYDPFVPMKDYKLGTTTFVQYFARDLNRRWTRYEGGVTGFFGTFLHQPK